MNTAEAARYFFLSPTEIRRLVRIGYLPYNVRRGRFVIDQADLDVLARDFPDTYQAIPPDVAQYVEGLRGRDCVELATMVEAFQPVYQREDVGGLHSRAARRGHNTAARIIRQAVDEALADECPQVSTELAVVGALTLLLESLRADVPGRPPPHAERV